MGKKTDKAIAKLRADVQALSEAVWGLKDQVRVEVAAESAANGRRSRKSEKLKALEERLGDETTGGQVTGTGAYRVPGLNGTRRMVRWEFDHAVDPAVPADPDAAAAMLAALGHRQRLAIVVTLLRQPMSVSDLVASLELGTSGAAYHHLNVLQNAGLVMQQERGTFELVPERVSGIVGVLSALAVEPVVEEVTADAAEPETAPAE